jgi:probable HAF family extracellular repeat protein
MRMYRTICCAILLSAFVIVKGSRIEADATPPAYAVTDLGTLGGGFTAGTGINASGQVAGSSFTPGLASINALLWTPTSPNGVSGMLHDLGPGVAYDINDSAQLTGHTDPGLGEVRAFLYDGTMHDLGTLGGTLSEGFGINASGQVTGLSFTAEGNAHGFLFDGALHDLGSLGGTSGYGRAINDSGQVVGTSKTTGDANFHAYLWTPTTPNGVNGTMIDLGTLGGGQSGADGVNASGQVTGYSFTTGNVDFHAFLYDGAMHDLGTLGGANSYGNGINDSGQVVGDSLLTGGRRHAFLYTSGNGMEDLNSLIDPLSGWELEVANAINEAGQITGFGQIAGETRAFLLTPIPEPASLMPLALGLPLLVFRSSRRSSGGGTRGAHRP